MPSSAEAWERAFTALPSSRYIFFACAGSTFSSLASAEASALCAAGRSSSAAEASAAASGPVSRGGLLNR